MPGNLIVLPNKSIALPKVLSAANPKFSAVIVARLYCAVSSLDDVGGFLIARLAAAQAEIAENI